MGKLEKIVVVTVLFLVAVILGVSLNSGEADSGKAPVASGDGKSGRARPRAGEAAETQANATSKAAADAPGGLLNATVDAPPAGAAPNAIPPTNSQMDRAAAGAPGSAPVAPAIEPAVRPAAQPGALLVTRAGLEPTALDDLMAYSWQPGDSFARVSERYYGSPLHVGRLRKANEGVDEKSLQPGAKILVPVLASAFAANAPAQPAPVAAPESRWTGGLYEVAAGEVLGTISMKVYGTSKKWKKIYDANRDVIGDDPNRLRVGTKLRIPE
jgi:nucleoid-associated protein YgaU